MADMAFLDGFVHDEIGNPIDKALVVIEKESNEVEGRVDKTNPDGYYMIGEIELKDPAGDKRSIVCWRRPIETEGNEIIRYHPSFVDKVLVKGINHQNFTLEER